ncbi:RsmB/NOP family class I SAM-dependent RNA methyltransferase [Cyclobacterium amurskyense]|uniref:16S rRNA (Cytosine(967)-C(5))-methyltransferase n=1 Tax=Cyclobacterium amurskyense TaxID=320787 RepID=A0A0H4P982_9BACT|nr:methyltransferase domain-containing protein [Cyclobacterium amurskyense]AKP51021.1 16S rRNA (Cytosine(967)-C(5))-methyltransferase [Cyclobacterium amurskyense]|tara:strand:+ start:2276 stop:3481 length:1206 start_codon:yes stop_codon:yes gene_type:complete
MKLFPNTVNAVVKALEEIFDNNRYADKVIEKVLRSNPKWGARDRAFIAESVYEIVRWKRLIEKLSPSNDYYQWFGTYWVLQDRTLPDWREFKGINGEKIRHYRSKISERAILQSIPDWMEEMGSSQLGDKWDEEINSLNEQAQVVLRANTLKTARTDLKVKLEELDVKAYIPREYPDALVLLKRKNVFRTPLFKEGLFEVQDASSQMVAAALEVEPGMRVIDACAGAGGKALHLAALMENKGRILAMDTEGWKLQNAKLRARRAGISILETKPIESNKTIKRLHESADRLLLDVPCSGLGVLKRNPDTKWKLNEESIAKVQVLQKEILSQYPSMLKPGGIMVYATCSILPSENNKQVEAFLASENGQKFELIEETQVLSHESGFDGFYIAKIRKKNLAEMA